MEFKLKMIKELIAKPQDKGTVLLDFQGVRGFKLVQEESNVDGTIYKIYRGKDLWATFYNDKFAAISSMINTYAGTLNRVLEEAKKRVENPDSSKEKDSKLQSVDNDDMPLLTKEINP